MNNTYMNSTYMNRISKNLPRNIVVGLIAPLFLLGGCEQAPSELPAAKTFLSLCPGFNETGKSPLVYGAECGNLSLLENPEDPASSRIDIAVLRLPAISPVAKADPVFFIQGGPGGSSIEMAKQLQGHFSDLRKNRDLIFVDQRGTGTSNPLQCAAAKFDAQQPEAEAMAHNLQRMRQCAEKYQEHIAYYTTPYAVADLDEVRRALGYAQINIWGGSYGTRVALAYARAYPAAARSLVLDGVAPVALALPHYFARDAMAALQRVNAECAALAECRAQFGDIVVKAEQVSARLAKANAAGAPLVVSWKP
jgi:pimeloyl-ACP methyl ester carboxylesterase